MKSRKETTYGILLLIATVLFVLPCIFLVFPTFDIHRDDLWQMDSLMEFICAYKNTAILAIAGVLIQIVIALSAGYAIARVSSFKAQMFFIVTCVFFLLLPQQALMLPQYLVLMNIGWLDSLKGLLMMTAFQPWMILLFWFAAKRIDSSLFDAAICDGASNWVLFRKIYVPIVRPYVTVAAFVAFSVAKYMLGKAVDTTTYEKVVVNSLTYEVLFTHDNSYYTHCYHQTMSYYNSGASAPFRTDTDYYQAVGG